MRIVTKDGNDIEVEKNDWEFIKVGGEGTFIGFERDDSGELTCLFFLDFIQGFEATSEDESTDVCILNAFLAIENEV